MLVPYASRRLLGQIGFIRGIYCLLAQTRNQEKLEYPMIITFDGAATAAGGRPPEQVACSFGTVSGVSINPHYAQLVATQKYRLDTFSKFQEPDRICQKWYKANSDLLASLTGPKLDSVEKLETLSMFYATLFLHDDVIDKKDSRISSQELRDQHVDYLIILGNSIQQNKRATFCQALGAYQKDIIFNESDGRFIRAKPESAAEDSGKQSQFRSYLERFCDQLSKITSKSGISYENLGFFISGFINYLLSLEEEKRLKDAAVELSVDRYELLRMNTGAVVPSFYLILALSGCDLVRLTTQAPFQQAMNAGVQHVCYVNDVVSCPKEIKEEDSPNLVKIIREQNDLTTWGKAIAIAQSIITDRLRKFEEHGGETQGALRLISHFMDGHIFSEYASISPEFCRHFKKVSIPDMSIEGFTFNPPPEEFTFNNIVFYPTTTRLDQPQPFALPKGLASIDGLDQTVQMDFLASVIVSFFYQLEPGNQHLLDSFLQDVSTKISGDPTLAESLLSTLEGLDVPDPAKERFSAFLANIRLPQPVSLP